MSDSIQQVRFLYRSEARYVVVLQSPDYPKRIWTKIESDNFRERFGTGSVISIRYTTVTPGFFTDDDKYGRLPFDRSIPQKICARRLKRLQPYYASASSKTDSQHGRLRLPRASRSQRANLYYPGSIPDIAYGCRLRQTLGRKTIDAERPLPPSPRIVTLKEILAKLARSASASSCPCCSITSRRARAYIAGDQVRCSLVDVPVLTAVIGVSGTLLGTIVGGCLTMVTNFLLQKRREQADFRIACRLIAGELDENEGLLEGCVQAKSWWPPEIEPGTKAWEQHQHVLASHLSYEAWSDVWAAIRGAHFAHNLVVNAGKGEVAMISDEDLRMLTSYAALLQKGRVSLEPYVRKSR